MTEHRGNTAGMIAATLVVAIVVCACKSKLSVADRLNMDRTPTQAADSMYLVQTDNGRLQMRVFAARMEKYENDSLSTEVFPKGIEVYSYMEDGVLESTIVANAADHERRKTGKAAEVWRAYGNVVIRNIVKQETMETDTLYWDRERKEIHTDCYVRMFSEDGFIQGYGLRSDERVRNARVLRPFNSYSVVVRDTARILIDSVNFIGPLLRK